MTLRQTVRISLFASLSAALGFLLAPVPNVELLTFSLFVSGYALGLRSGAVAGLLAVALYYGLNPYGSSLVFPLLFACQALAALWITTLGAFFARLVSPLGSGLMRRVLLVPFAILSALALPLSPVFAFSGFAGEGQKAWLFLGALMTSWGLAFNLLVFLSSFEPMARTLARIEARRRREVPA
ncbi:MAG: hypothetical protein QF492_05190 [Candidatus Krumholzibacteria bacterium]|jgi:hypothetical protein|nr:hypothetical protein [Candidatus Krumholzibacteria bacterium]MDP6669283.1 hypothetical protein [Candidatus Krumholzibacteria bacterium]MDP6796585.1 hypothetical protein [Candidatus Krumholzibacteria bacterium]MDP7020751.1 hypothetical protein [Candidatus Krumholzibacteria bacterium]